jgi:hypothetical protein
MKMRYCDFDKVGLWVIVIVSVAWLCYADYLQYDYLSQSSTAPPDWFPTDEEFERGMVVKPPVSYFQAFAGEKSIRWLALGGSNTVGSDYAPRMKERLESLAKENDFEFIYWNGGVSGMGPTLQRFVFEDLPANKWPNFVTLEFGMNTANFETVQSLDELLQYIEYKWQQKGARIPAYLILELWRIRQLYKWDLPGWAYPMEDRNACSNEEIAFNENVTKTLSPPVTFGPNDEAFNRGMPMGLYHHAVARFYRIPLLSGQDAFWPSFVRYYMHHVSCSQWPFIHKDGCHISRYGGQTYIDKIVAPFLQTYLVPVAISQLLKGKSVTKTISGMSIHSQPSSASSFVKVTVTTGPTDGRVSDYPEITPFVRMFPRLAPQSLTIRFSKALWGTSSELMDFLDNVFYADDAFGLQYLQRHEGSHNHRCYGATGVHSKGANIFFYLPISSVMSDDIVTSQEKVKNIFYSVVLGYLHSWNTSYVGDIECRMLQTNLSQPTNLETLRASIQSAKNQTHFLSALLTRVDAQPIVNGVVAVASKVADPWKGQKIEGHRHGHGGNLKSSGPRMTMLNEKFIGGHYLLQCRKLDERLSCFTGFQVLDAP